MSEVRIDLSGIERLLRDEPEKVETWLDGFAESMVTEIKLSFNTSPPGQTYVRGNVVHVASQEGYPPSVDTGTLMNSIRWEDAGKLTRHIMDGVEYGIYLEEGTENMGPRPFMEPAFLDAQQRFGDDARDNLGLEDI